jgi:hypothetical protein
MRAMQSTIYNDAENPVSEIAEQNYPFFQEFFKSIKLNNFYTKFDQIAADHELNLSTDYVTDLSRGRRTSVLSCGAGRQFRYSRIYLQQQITRRSSHSKFNFLHASV